jgi:hypothetical protein
VGHYIESSSFNGIEFVHAGGISGEGPKFAIYAHQINQSIVKQKFTESIDPHFCNVQSALNNFTHF